MSSQQTCWKTFRLTAKDKHVTLFDLRIPVRSLHLAAQEPKTTPSIGGVKFIPRVPGHQIESVPIIHPGTTSLFSINGETERTNKMKPRSGRHAKTGYIPSILGNLGLDQHDMKHGFMMNTKGAMKKVFYKLPTLDLLQIKQTGATGISYQAQLRSEHRASAPMRLRRRSGNRW